MGTGGSSLGVKRPERDTDHSYSSSAEVKNAKSYTSTLPYVFMAWCLVKHRGNFTFTSTLLIIIKGSFMKLTGFVVSIQKQPVSTSP
jgi:hypothetical protein